VRSGFGAGTKDPKGRANALRIVLAEKSRSAESNDRESLVSLAADLDDMSGEYVAEVAERLREAGALDVVIIPTLMKKGRPGTRIELLADANAADALEALLLEHSTTIGVRRWTVERRALTRQYGAVSVLGHEIRVKVASLPGGGRRVKPEFDDVSRVARVTGQSASDIFALATRAAERM
jgi:uncharacterized protein (DUF111 family)